MPLEPVPTLYATRADVESIFSSQGIDWRLDDNDDATTGTTEQGYLTDAIREATDIVNQYALTHYDEAQLSTSRVVTRWTAWIACFLLSRRRGNEAQFTDEYLAITEELTRVRSGQQAIPRLATRANFFPQAQNYRIGMNPGCPSRCETAIPDEGTC